MDLFSYTKKKIGKKLRIIFEVVLVGIINIHNNKLVHDT